MPTVPTIKQRTPSAAPPQQVQHARAPAEVAPTVAPRQQAEATKRAAQQATPVVPPLGYTKPATGKINTHARGRRADGVEPAESLKGYRQNSFQHVPFAVAHARCFFPAMKKMTMMGFRCPTDFFSPTQATAKARKKPRKCTDRTITIGTCFIDFKGRFTCSKDGGYTSILAFKHALSKHVHEVYLTDQKVSTCEKAFADYKRMMKIEFGIDIDECVFDRDTSFNAEFCKFLRSIFVLQKIHTRTHREQKITINWAP
jgi:hypothetical protein